jgi:hypothetical protein
MFYSVTQSFLNFLRILNRLEVCVFARAVKLESPCTIGLYQNSTFVNLEDFERTFSLTRLIKNFKNLDTNFVKLE